MRRCCRLVATACLVPLVTVSGCAAQSAVPTDSGIGALHGRAGPGAPPEGHVPATLDVVFTSGGEEVRTTAPDGMYENELPVGTWDVRTADDGACASDVPSKDRRGSGRTSSTPRNAGGSASAHRRDRCGVS